MQIAHEAPLCMMRRVRGVTDYCYALVHLFEECQEYYDYFIESKTQGRKVLLDNSIFELGTAFNSDKFADWISRLQPTEYIVPDVLEDSDKTIQNFKEWNSKYNNLPGKKIGVVQGKTYQEMYDCYKFMSEHADKIAISFDYSYYQLTAAGSNKYVRYAEGRHKLINCFMSDGIINTKKPHHLLGCSLAYEFGYYGSFPNTFSFIESLDTSNPVVAGMHNVQYEKFGLKDKISVKLIDLFHKEVSPEQENIILENINKFRAIANIPNSLS
jgi:hypothetical protein